MLVAIERRYWWWQHRRMRADDVGYMLPAETPLDYLRPRVIRWLTTNGPESMTPIPSGWRVSTHQQTSN